jgi:hypothetical protein
VAGFLGGLAARSALLLGATVGLNLLVDPLGVYGSRLFEPIVLRTRGPKLYLYQHLRPAPPILILGSSRSFNVDPRYVEARTSRRAFNAAVGGAGVRDYVEFARCAAARGRFPRLLIVAVGVEQALSDARTFERNDLMADCLRARTTLSERLQAYRGLVTLDETWASVRVLGLEVTGRPAPAFSFGGDGMIRGVASPPRAARERAVSDSLATSWGPANFAPERLSPESVELLRQLLDLCREQGAQVIVYLPPYHPRAVALYLAESHFGSARAQLLAQLASWATQYPLRYYDFTEVASFGGSEEMFDDASHPSEQANRLLLDVMLAHES